MSRPRRPAGFTLAFLAAPELRPEIRVRRRPRGAIGAVLLLAVLALVSAGGHL